jgi:hypothetical protein
MKLYYLKDKWSDDVKKFGNDLNTKINNYYSTFKYWSFEKKNNNKYVLLFDKRFELKIYLDLFLR